MINRWVETAVSAEVAQDLAGQLFDMGAVMEIHRDKLFVRFPSGISYEYLYRTFDFITDLRDGLPEVLRWRYKQLGEK